MPAVARLAPRRRQVDAPFPVLDLSRPVAPPSADLIAAVLAHADIEEDAGLGRVRRRLSRERADHLEALGLIDVPAARAADVAVLWDERQGEVIRVLDDAPVTARAQAQSAWWESYWDEPAPARPRLALAGRRGWAEGAR